MSVSRWEVGWMILLDAFCFGCLNVNGKRAEYGFGEYGSNTELSEFFLAH